MRLNPQIAGVLLIGAAALAAVTYGTIERRSERAAAAPAQAVASAPAPASKSPAAPAASPAEANSPPAPADASAAYTHYRIGNSTVRSIHADGALMWVGTSSGLFRYDSSKDNVKLFDTRDGVRAGGIFHVGKLKGRIVLGTHGAGLSTLEPDTQRWAHYDLKEGLADRRVFDVLEAANGDVWIATWSGANRVRAGALNSASEWERYTVASTNGALPSDRVYALAQGRDGAIWLATEGGLARFVKGKWSSWSPADVAGASQEKPSAVVSLEVDRNGIVWAGTLGGGLARFDGKRWRSYTTADGLPGTHVFALHADDEGRLWIGTNNGLARLERGAFKVLGAGEGLLGNAVFSISTPADGTVWAGGHGGVAHIRKLAWRAAR